MADKKTGTITPKASDSNRSFNTEKKPDTRTLHTTSSNRLFTKDNYIWMLIGLAVIALGMFLMSGGRSTDPNVFDQKEVYSARRITIAPLLIIIGLGIEVFAIFKKPRS
jgi:hypothetical protein